MCAARCVQGHQCTDLLPFVWPVFSFGVIHVRFFGWGGGGVIVLPNDAVIMEMRDSRSDTQTWRDNELAACSRSSRFRPCDG